LAQAAAVGLAALVELRTTHRKIWLVVLFSLGAGLWLLAPAWTANVPPGNPRTQALTGLRFAALLMLLVAAISSIARRRWSFAVAGLISLLLVELIAVGALAETEPTERAIEKQYAEALTFLRADPGWFRVDVDNEARGLWSPSGLVADGFAVPQGTGNPMELYRYNQFYWKIPHKDSPAYQLLGVKYIIVPKDNHPGGEGIWPVFKGTDYIDIHLNTNSLNRTWAVFNTVPVDNLAEAHEVIFAPDFTPGSAATIEDGPRLSSDGQVIDLVVQRYSPNHASFEVEVTERALLVLSDLHYDGWRAELDGQPTPLYVTNAIFRGVVVPPGRHRIDMHFFPDSLRLGIGLAVMAVMISGAAFKATRDTRRLSEARAVLSS
jgi:hypothetical protein